MKRLLNLTTLTGVIVSLATAASAQTALEAASTIEGTYEGEWTMYRVEAGEPVASASWTDVLTAGPAVDEADRASVEVTDVMTFGDGTERTSVMREGYLKEPGTDQAANRYYQFDDTMVVYHQLSPHDWTFWTEPTEGELWALGFNPAQVVSASHVTTRSTTELGTDHVTRVTTIVYNDDTGQPRAIQFVSLQGTHRRVS